MNDHSGMAIVYLLFAIVFVFGVIVGAVLF